MRRKNGSMLKQKRRKRKGRGKKKKIGVVVLGKFEYMAGQTKGYKDESH